MAPPEDRKQTTEDRKRPSVRCRLSSVFCRLILVGLGRFELPTSRLSSARSNQLSYKPGSEDRGRMTENRPSIHLCHLTSVLRRRLIREEREMKTAASRPVG